MNHKTAFRTTVVLFFLAISSLASATGNISVTDKYAWSETGGWNNLAPTGGGVTILPDHLEGYAWSETIGWIKLGSYTGGGSHVYTNSDGTNWGVNLTGSSLSGYAWSETGGWINFKPTGGAVTLDTTTGILDGYAWSESLGWLHFKGSNYDVSINKLNLTVALAGNGGGTVHSTPTGISCDTNGGCSNSFFQNWPVTLGAVPDWKSLFTGYSGDSTAATFTLDTAKSVTATFDPNYRAKLVTADTPYASIQDAYDNAPSPETIDAQAYYFQEPGGVTMGKTFAKTITLKGGFTLDDPNYSVNYGMTWIKGPLSIRSGKLTAERITIR